MLTVGYREGRQTYHLLPPRPATFSLDTIYLCTPAELWRFTSSGHFGYFRHILRSLTLPISELLASHLKMAHASHLLQGDPNWFADAARELITLLRDDHATLTSVLGALANIDPDWAA